MSQHEAARGPDRVADDEHALVLRLKARDNAAFETLVRSHGPRLLSVARRVTGSEDDARDVLQDALLSAYRSMDGFAEESRLSTWLHRIVVNTALMRMRSRRRRPEEPIDELLPAWKADGHHEAKFVEWPDAERALSRRETREVVRGAIAQLPDSYRDVLTLRDIEGLDTAETAGALGLTENAVKIRLHRARQALRTLLDPHLREGAV